MNEASKSPCMKPPAVSQARSVFAAKLQTPTGAFQELLAGHTGLEQGYVPLMGHAVAAVLSTAKLQDVAYVLDDMSRVDRSSSFEAERAMAASLVGSAAVALMQVATAMRMDFETLLHEAIKEAAHLDGEEVIS